MNNKPELTQWIDGCFYPSVPGVYERQICGWPCYSRWTGSQWAIGDPSPLVAAKETLISCIQAAKWRGLAVKP